MNKNPQNPQYKLIVQRQKEYNNVKGTGSALNKPAEDATISSVRLENDKGEVLFNCFCCENGGPSTDTPRQDKRIVARDYSLRWTSTGVNGGCARAYPKWQAKNDKCPVKISDGTQGENIGIWVVSSIVANFAKRRIIIHTGNCPQHTEGCLLFGYSDNKDGTIVNSAKCVSDFYDLALKLGLENITLIVREIEKEKTIDYGR